MKIYGIYMDCLFFQEENEWFMFFILFEKQEKCWRFYYKEDVYCILLGDVFVCLVISRQYQLDKVDICFSVQEYGKFCIFDFFDVYFNIFYFGCWVICVFDLYLIGIDIEKMKLISFEIVKCFFLKIEYSDFLVKNKDEQIDYFYYLWLMKESFIKQEGKGLLFLLDFFLVCLYQDG